MAVADLVTAIQARIPSARLTTLTNPKDKTATSADSTKLTRAANSAVNRFAFVVGRALDTDDDTHLDIGTLFAEAWLVQWHAGMTREARAMWKFANEEAEAYALTSSRDAIDPTSSSNVTVQDDGARRPYFQPRHFDGLRADPPTGGEGEDLDPVR